MASGFTTFPIRDRIDLLVRLGHATVTIAAREGLQEATVRLTPRGEGSDVLDRVTVEMRGSTLLVSGPRQGGLVDFIGVARRGRDGVDATIEVPSGTPVTIVTGGGDISVIGTCGDADITTGSAAIRLDTVSGNLRLRYGRGESRVETVSGSVHVRGGKGTAHFGRCAGGVDCGFGAGELSAGVISGELRARAGSGSAQLDAVHDNVDVALGSGPITIGLPAAVAARVDITSGTGQAHSDLPVDQAPSSGAKPITVRARTGSGEVRLFRAATAA